MIMTLRTEQLIANYNALTKDDLADKTKLIGELLKTWYHEEIVFVDPLKQVCGISQLQSYFTAMYGQVSHCYFETKTVQEHPDSSFVSWTMTFSHPKLNKGKEINLDGCSELHWQQGKILFHRDYFDAGAMLYQHLPLIGGLIRWINNKAGH
jgi:hypothetical protein